LTGHIRIVNDPLELVPLVITFNNKEFKKVYDMLAKSWLTEEELFLNKGNLIEEQWRMPKPGEAPKKEFKTTYSKFRANFQCSMEDLSDILHISVSTDEGLRKLGDDLEVDVRKGNTSYNDIARKLNATPVFVKALAKRMPHLDVKRENDPLYIILRSKREATRFQILVEIAEHQPSVRQQEIAEILGVTPQAVSEYIRELVDDGMVASHGRGRYNVTHTGIEWVMNNAEALESYAHHVTHEVIQPVVVWTALSACDIKKGDTVGVFMKGGMLFADFGKHAATGMSTLDAKKGMDVGVSNLTGIIDHSEGIVHVCKVPRIERGGSRNVSRTLLLEVIDGVDVVGAVLLKQFFTDWNVLL